MQDAVLTGQAFDRNQFFAIQCRQKLNTGIDRTNMNGVTAVIKLGNDDRAGTTVSFGTAFFRSRAAQILAQILQHGPGRIEVTDLDDLAVQHEGNRGRCRFVGCARMHIACQEYYSATPVC